MKQLERIDEWIHGWMAQSGVWLLRAALGTVFLWFGVLTFFPGLRPADDLLAHAMTAWTRGLLGPGAARSVLAAWSCLIGLGLVSGRQVRAARALILLRILGTILAFPFASAATGQGQLAAGSLVLLTSGLLMVAARPGYLVPAQVRASRVEAREPRGARSSENVTELRSA